MNYKEKLNKIKTFVFDVDGVFTDGKIMVDSEGNESRSFNTKDGIAVKLANDLGYNIAIITGANSEGIRARLNRLGIKNVYLSSVDKVKDLLDYSKKYNINLEKTVYMGDDLPDTFPMNLVELKSCPFDAAPEVREICDYISNKNGGEGCVRDIIEQTLKVQGNWSMNKKNQNI
ncbi:HAD-IIIA family hydrolase [Flavobacteriaceae bacterium]|jgi:3-deoxy-D-manno-octulosonate 8-phosphate phosphatase (KDO 8-P phosphatase)|nr:HAD-IIIA family hydrolase [Flavobacteriaceae bacterium]|tara:strand:- start:579 stop:1100 length:522 start_codon:yes stop_codon:yes gene_type:complete